MLKEILTRSEHEIYKLNNSTLFNYRKEIKESRNIINTISIISFMMLVVLGLIIFIKYHG